MTKIDTTQPIWDRKWLCSVPALQTTSEEYIRFFGTPTTGVPAIDKELSKEWLNTALSIDEMVEYHKQGVPIRIKQFDDTKKIYEYIEDHLEAWANNLKNNLNIGDAPIEDLLAMDDFANKVYPYARSLYKDEPPTSSFMRAIEKLGFNSFNNQMLGKEAPVEKPELKRPDVRDVFKNVASGFNRWN